MLNDKYGQWIKNYKGEIFRRCVEVTAEMRAQFPELRVAKGLVTIVENCKDYQHQWLVAPDGGIIDPTARQWLGIIDYKEIGDNDPKPIGKCLNCGEYVFENMFSSIFCGDRCAKEAAAFV